MQAQLQQYISSDLKGGWSFQLEDDIPKHVRRRLLQIWRCV